MSIYKVDKMNEWVQYKDHIQHYWHKWYIIQHNQIRTKLQQDFWLDHISDKNWVTSKTINDLKMIFSYLGTDDGESVRDLQRCIKRSKDKT